MKRTFIRIFFLLLLTVLLAGCGKAAPEPTPQIVYVTVTPEPASEPAPAAEAPQTEEAPEPMEEPGFPLDEVPLPEEGAFPGGLDDDGWGEDEDIVYPVRDVDMTPEQQYEANVFLSNFAEQWFGDYYALNDLWVEDMVNFAHGFFKINHHDAIEYRNGFEYIPYAAAEEVIERYFPVYFSQTLAEDYPAGEHSFYDDGGFWFEAADGEAYNRFAVAQELTLLSDETYAISFSIYELDLDEYFDRGLSSDYYFMTAQEAADAPNLTKVAEGHAIALPYSYGDRATFQLLEYVTW